MRHCISDTNLLKLEHEYRHRAIDRMEPLMTRSEEDLTCVNGHMHGDRHCNVSDFCIIEKCGNDEEGDVCRLQRTNGPGKVQDSGLHRPHSSTDVHTESDDEDALDYKKRRARSTDTSPVLEQRRLGRYPVRNVRNTKSGSKPHLTTVNMNSPELSVRRKGRDRSASRPKMSWISRYHPGVPIPMASARESIVQAELRQMEKEFCTPRTLR